MDEVVIATSVNSVDDIIEEIAGQTGIRCFRGSEDDVLSRFHDAAIAYSADAIVRLTSDCPLLDPALISQVVAIWRLNPHIDYVATTIDRSLPRGLDVELASFQGLSRANEEATGYHRTHVTSLMYAQGSDYNQVSISVRPSSADLRVTLDTPEDALAIERLVHQLNQVPPAWNDVVRILRSNPLIVATNSMIQQKTLNEG